MSAGSTASGETARSTPSTRVSALPQSPARRAGAPPRPHTPPRARGSSSATAPRRSSSTWMSPIPPPISSTDAPSRPFEPAKSTMLPRRGRQPIAAILARQLAGESSVELLLVSVRACRGAQHGPSTTVQYRRRVVGSVHGQSRGDVHVVRSRSRAPTSSGGRTTRPRRSNGCCSPSATRAERCAWPTSAPAPASSRGSPWSSAPRSWRSIPTPPCSPSCATQVHGVPTFVGSAERMPLPDASVDALLFGQAWHWVDPAAGSRGGGAGAALGRRARARLEHPRRVGAVGRAPHRDHARQPRRGDARRGRPAARRRRSRALEARGLERGRGR